MCGIVGRFHFDAENASTTLIRTMADQIIHRGPDDDGFFVDGPVSLGMRRLSIIDVSGGKQPIFNEDGTICVVFNGEIYNYGDLTRDLISKGHRFKTHCDTETLVHLYEEEGTQFVRHLNGMFAIALWDQKKRVLIVARDRVGIKPLSYYHDDHVIVFGSEIKSLLVCPEVRTEPDEAAIMDYLIKGKYLYTQTFFRGIQHLRAGHMLEISSSGVQDHEFWDFRFRPAASSSPADLAHRLVSTIHSSVAAQLMSEVPIGSYLSGGIDSSSVAVAAARAYPGRINTFSAVFPGHADFNEDRFQHEVVAATNMDHHENLLTPDDFLDDVSNLMWHIEQPLAGITVGQYQMARFTKQWVTVVLTGHGGDELFGGYPNHLVGAFMDNTRRRWYRPLAWKTLVRDLRELLDTLGTVKVIYNLVLFARPLPALRRLILRLYEARLKRRMSTTVFRKKLGSHFTHSIIFTLLKQSNARTWLDRMLYVDIKLWLHNILMVEDKESMAHSLEDRVPLLDNTIIDLAAEVPSGIKITGMTLKAYMRNALHDVLPGDLLTHKKMGFPQPVGQWMKDPLIAERVHAMVKNGELTKRGILSSEYVSTLLEDHFDLGRDRSWELWQLICVESWFNRFFPGGNRINAVNAFSPERSVTA